MGILATILIGFVIGIIAKFLMPGRNPSGFIITVALGIAGSFIASYLGQAMGYYRADQPAGFVASVIGAMLLLGIYHAFTSRRALNP